MALPAQTASSATNNQPERVNYADRRRNEEWRKEWFHLIHSRDDKELIETWQRGIDAKRQMIDKQRGASLLL